MLFLKKRENETLSIIDIDSSNASTRIAAIIIDEAEREQRFFFVAENKTYNFLLKKTHKIFRAQIRK